MGGGGDGGRRNALNSIQNWHSLISNWKHCWCNTAELGLGFPQMGLAILWPLPCSRPSSFRSTGCSFIWRSKEHQGTFLRDGLCSLSEMLNCFKSPWQGLGPNQAMLSQTSPTTWDLRCSGRHCGCSPTLGVDTTSAGPGCPMPLDLGANNVHGHV